MSIGETETSLCIQEKPVDCSIHPDYRQTEIGPIPVDWCFTTVGELYRDSIIDKPMDGNHGNIHPKKSDFVDHGIPFVMANDIKNGVVDFSDCAHISKQQADSLMKGFSIEGDVLLTHKATMGATAVVGKISWPYIMLTPQVTYYRIKDDNRLSNSYLRHFFDCNAFQSRLEELSGGGTRAYLGIVGQHKLPILFPTALAEQQAIAEALGDAGTYIKSLEQLLAKKSSLKQATMQRLLTGKTRLLGFDATDWVESAVGSIPSDWKVSEVREVSRVTRGRVISHREIDASIQPIYPVYSSQTTNNGVMGYIDTYDFEGEYITWTTDGANAGTVFYREGRFNCTNVCGAIKLKHGNHQFFAAALGRVAGKHVSRQLGNPKIMSDVMKRVAVAIPSKVTEQTAIAEVLSDMDAEITAIEAKIDKARQIKTGMMQELLTGKTRLV